MKNKKNSHARQEISNRKNGKSTRISLNWWILYVHYNLKFKAVGFSVPSADLKTRSPFLRLHHIDSFLFFLQITYTSHSIKNSLYFPRFFLLPSFSHDYIHLFFILNLSCILLNFSKIVNILHLTKCIYAHFCNHPQKKMKRVWFPTTLFILISSFFTYKKCLSPFYNT